MMGKVDGGTWVWKEKDNTAHILTANVTTRVSVSKYL